MVCNVDDYLMEIKVYSISYNIIKEGVKLRNC